MEYSPQELFSGIAPARSSPRVLVAPNRYIQGNGVLERLGSFLSIVPSRRPALLITAGGLRRVGAQILAGLKQVQIDPVTVIFAGECSEEEVRRNVESLKDGGVDALIAAGGGKCLDAGKCVAHCLSVPAIMCPTLASTDAPCSAVSVMYTPEGAFHRPWFFPDSPALVVVDTGVIARAPVRHLVAGMGDAMSTCYEARTCFRNQDARNMVGARPTAAALAIAELCAQVLFRDGIAALQAVARGEVDAAVENVVEANTLLSGIGFESGGLAASHAIGQVFSLIARIHRDYLHGEMVALGLLSHLCLEGERGEALRVAEFFAAVGLPVHLGQLSIDPARDGDEIEMILEEAAKVFFVHYEPFEVNAAALKEALLEAHRLGVGVCRSAGDAAYRALHQPAAECAANS
jgi:glycerol dehydrogenase